MEKLKLEHWDISKLVEYARNPRKNDEVVERMKASIKEFGFRIPIVAKSDGTVVDGHLRLKAGRALGLESVPVVLADELTETQIKAFRLLANQSANWAEWDTELLTLEIDDLKLEGFDVELLGFDFELEELPSQIESEPGEVPEPPAEPKTKRGDLWRLGNHRLLCGDSTSIDDVEKLMDGAYADLLFTSPPYSDQRTYNGNKDLSVDHIASFIPTYSNFCDVIAVNLGLKMNKGEVVRYWDDFIDTASSTGLKLLAWNVWHKVGGIAVGMQINPMFPIEHEWIFVFGKERKEINKTVEKKEESIITENWSTVRRQADGSMKRTTTGDTSNPLKKMGSVVAVQTDKSHKTGHPAIFPVKLAEEHIKAMTDPGGTVVDSFGGSGSTMIACEQLNRNCCMMELDEGYCDIIINRWQKLTGKDAVLESTGQTYNDL